MKFRAFRKKSSLSSGDVVADVEQQTQQAVNLSSIAAQDLLEDPRTNPATRGEYDRLRDARQRRSLELEHARRLRQDRVADQCAAHAERTLEAIRQAHQTRSPARSVLALHRARRYYMAVALAASLTLSVGSALGVAAWAATWGAPAGVGYFAEVGLTGLATTVILYRSHLTAHRGAAGGWQGLVLWGLMLVPLVGSIIASTAGSGPVGAACSIGAAAWSLLAYTVADRSAAAAQARADEVDAADERELRATAMGEGLTGRSTPAEAWVREQADVAADQITAWLAGQDPPEGGVTPAQPAPTPHGPHDAAHPLIQGTEPADTAPGHIDSEQGIDPRSHEVERRELTAAEARRLAGEQTRGRIAAYLDKHPTASVSQIAAAVSKSESTVKRHLRELRDGGR